MCKQPLRIEYIRIGIDYTNKQIEGKPLYSHWHYAIIRWYQVEVLWPHYANNKYHPKNVGVRQDIGVHCNNMYVVRVCRQQFIGVDSYKEVNCDRNPDYHLNIYIIITALYGIV